MQKKENSIDVELFNKHYPSLLKYSLCICTKHNRQHLAKDLLHETIHEYLSHHEKAHIRRPIEWIKSVMYRSLTLPNTSFYSTFIRNTQTHEQLNPTDDDAYIYRTDYYTKIYRDVSKHLDANFDFVERTLMQLRLKGMNNKEIAEMLDISYDTVCRINRETQEQLKGQVTIEP